MLGGRASSILKLFWGDKSKKTPCMKVYKFSAPSSSQLQGGFFNSSPLNLAKGGIKKKTTIIYPPLVDKGGGVPDGG